MCRMPCVHAVGQHSGVVGTRPAQSRPSWVEGPGAVQDQGDQRLTSQASEHAGWPGSSPGGTLTAEPDITTSAKQDPRLSASVAAVVWERSLSASVAAASRAGSGLSPSMASIAAAAASPRFPSAAPWQHVPARSAPASRSAMPVHASTRPDRVAACVRGGDSAQLAHGVEVVSVQPWRRGRGRLVGGDRPGSGSGRGLVIPPVIHPRAETQFWLRVDVCSGHWAVE